MITGGYVGNLIRIRLDHLFEEHSQIILIKLEIKWR
jgi:hypothetical protein